MSAAENISISKADLISADEASVYQVMQFTAHMNGTKPQCLHLFLHKTFGTESTASPL